MTNQSTVVSIYKEVVSNITEAEVALSCNQLKNKESIDGQFVRNCTNILNKTKIKLLAELDSLIIKGCHRDVIFKDTGVVIEYKEDLRIIDERGMVHVYRGIAVSSELTFGSVISVGQVIGVKMYSNDFSYSVE